MSTIKINTRGMSHLEAVISKKIPFGTAAASKDHGDAVVVVPTGWQAVHHPDHSINDTHTHARDTHTYLRAGSQTLP